MAEDEFPETDNFRDWLTNPYEWPKMIFEHLFVNILLKGAKKLYLRIIPEEFRIKLNDKVSSLMNLKTMVVCLLFVAGGESTYIYLTHEKKLGASPSVTMFSTDPNIKTSGYSEKKDISGDYVYSLTLKYPEGDSTFWGDFRINLEADQTYDIYPAVRRGMIIKDGIRDTFSTPVEWYPDWVIFDHNTLIFRFHFKYEMQSGKTKISVEPPSFAFFEKFIHNNYKVGHPILHNGYTKHIDANHDYIEGAIEIQKVISYNDTLYSKIGLGTSLVKPVGSEYFKTQPESDNKK